MTHERQGVPQKEIPPREQLALLTDQLRSHPRLEGERTSFVDFATALQGLGEQVIADATTQGEIDIPGGVGEGLIVRNILTGSRASDARIGNGPSPETLYIFHPVTGLPLSFRAHVPASPFQPNRPEPSYAIISNSLRPEVLWKHGED